MEILFLSRWYPFPADNGSKLRIANLLQGLLLEHRVSLISFFNPDEGEPSTELPTPALSEIRVYPYREFNPHSCRAVLAYLAGTPRYLADTHSPEMEAIIRQTVRRNRFDVVIASQLSMACYHRCFHGIPAIFEEVELGIHRPSEMDSGWTWSGIHRRLSWVKHQHFMTQLLKNFRLCTVASNVERQLLAEAVPTFEAVHVIPNCVDVGSYVRTPHVRQPESLVFTGSLRFRPNHEAMTWFLEDIYPLIRKKAPGVQLKITGSPGPCPLPPAPNVVLTGRVADVSSVVASSAVSLAPIRNGGGTRLKILEAMALRTPVVATSKAAEGLNAQHSEHLLIADSPQDFAQAVLEILRKPDRFQKMVDDAFELVKSRYNSHSTLPRFMSLVDQAALA